MIFIMLVMVTTVVFGLGVFLGHEFQRVAVRADDPMANIGLKAEIPTEVEPIEVVLTEAKPPEKLEEKPEVIEEKPAEPKPLTGYTIQLDIVESLEVAELERRRIESLGYPSVFVRDAKLDDRYYYFIDLGYFKEKENAENFATRLLANGMISSYLIRRTDLDPSAVSE